MYVFHLTGIYATKIDWVYVVFYFLHMCDWFYFNLIVDIL